MVYRVIISDLNYTIEFNTYRRLKIYPGIGKSYPLVTQCVIREKDYIVGVGEVVLHKNDKEDSITATRSSLKKSITNIESKNIRSIIFNKVIEEHLERLQQAN